MLLWTRKTARRRTAAYVLVLSAGIFAAVMWYVYKETAQDRIVLNEACSNNFSVICDEDGVYSDYVELYNPGDEAVSLEGFFCRMTERRCTSIRWRGLSCRRAAML